MEALSASPRGQSTGHGKLQEALEKGSGARDGSGEILEALSWECESLCGPAGDMALLPGPPISMGHVSLPTLQVQPDVDSLEGGPQHWGCLQLSLEYDFGSQEVWGPLDWPRGSAGVRRGVGCRAGTGCGAD